MKKKPSDHHLPDNRTAEPFPGRWRQWKARYAGFDARERWWRFLDLLEKSRRLRRFLFALVGLAAAGAIVAFWGYPWWTRRNSIKLAREWLAAGRLTYAAEAVQQAMQLAPESPEPLQIAAEVARRAGQKDKAVEYARRAADVAPGHPELVVAWASEALRAELPEQADQALARLTAEQLARSPLALRVSGELARRRNQFAAAQGNFEAALRLDGPGGVDEVPLGVVLLHATDAAERQRGINLLAKWTTDRDWALVATRTLLGDAQARGDPPAMLQWAELLRNNPGRTNADMGDCLLAFSRADEARFASVLAALEKDHAVNPEAATQLLSWLNQIGRSAEAVRWIATLPAAARDRPPLAVAGAEALRQTADWPALAVWTEGKNWGPDAEFLRWAYGLQAARRQGEEPKAEELWRTLYSHAQLNSVHALFSASLIYSWGRVAEAEALWWRAAEQEGKIAIDALGSLARHYQVQRDADGLYRVFRRLHLLQPQDSAVANNFDFFAALTGHEQHLAEQVARANLARDPRNPVYLATCAFAVLVQGRAAEARALLEPFAVDAARSPALAFAYGLVLASTNQKAAAHRLLDGIPAGSLTVREQEEISTALRDN